MSKYLLLPLSSLRLLVPPVRLMSACMWQVAQQRSVDQYGKLAEFITLVTEAVPDLMSPKQSMQLILGLKARLILELLQKVGPFDCEVIQDHLNNFQLWTTNHMPEEVQDEEVKMSKSKFVELVQTLITDPSEKDTFFKEVFPVQYGACFDTVLQILVWEFFFRLEEFLPVPSFSQVASSVDLAALDPQFEQFVSDPEDLRILLQQRKRGQKLRKSEFSFMSDTILSTLASKQTSVACEVQMDHTVDGRSVESRQKAEQSLRRNEETEEKSSWTMEDACEEEEGEEEEEEEAVHTENSYSESVPSDSQLPSPLTEEADVAGDSDAASSLTPQIIYLLRPLAHKRPARLQQQVTEKHSGDNSSVQEAQLTREFDQICSPSAKRPKKHACPQCGKSYSRPSEVKHHLATAHSKKEVYSCDQCEKSFEAKHRLKRHLQAHAGVKPHICSYCGRGFSCPNVLKTHVRVHTGERPYACTLCDKRFNQPYTLTVHLRLHKGERPYLCSECGKGYPSSGALLIHSRLHTGERPYHCKVCGKNYVTLHRLKAHQQFHSDERPYPCSDCKKRFRTTCALKRHVRCHTGEKPFKCLLCNKRFSQAFNMKIHLKSHKS